MYGRCPICQEVFDPDEVAGLRCGHTFHFVCISQWLENASNCPSCRTVVKRTSDIIPQLYFDHGEETLPLADSAAAIKIQHLSEQLTSIEQRLKEKTESTVKLEHKNAILKRRVAEVEAAMLALRTQLELTDVFKQQCDHLQAKISELQKKLSTFQKLDVYLNGSAMQAEATVAKINSDSAAEMRIFLNAMKRKYEESCAVNAEITKKLTKAENERDKLKRANNELQKRPLQVHRKAVTACNSNNARNKSFDTSDEENSEGSDSILIIRDSFKSETAPSVGAAKTCARTKRISSTDKEPKNKKSKMQRFPDSDDDAVESLSLSGISKKVAAPRQSIKQYDGFGGRQSIRAHGQCVKSRALLASGLPSGGKKKS